MNFIQFLAEMSHPFVHDKRYFLTQIYRDDAIGEWKVTELLQCYRGVFLGISSPDLSPDDGIDIYNEKGRGMSHNRGPKAVIKPMNLRFYGMH